MKAHQETYRGIPILVDQKVIDGGLERGIDVMEEIRRSIDTEIDNSKDDLNDDPQRT